MTPKITPVGNRVLIIPTDQNSEEVLPSGLIIPRKEIPPSTRGKVVALGTKINDQIKVGDSVQYSQHSGIPFDWEGESYLMMKDTEIICIL
jgi:chaperonin GroES